jgi:hypothetical protein
MATTRLNHPVKESAPAYSFGKKGITLKTLEVPGPGEYVVTDVK